MKTITLNYYTTLNKNCIKKMNLSLIQRLKKYLSNLSLTSSFILPLILVLALKLPISLLFNLLDIKSYFYLFAGLFSGLVTYAKAVGNMEVPSKKALCLAIASASLTSLFFYIYPTSYLKDCFFSIGLYLGVSSIFEKLPSLKSLSGSNTGKFKFSKNSLSKLGNALRNYLFSEKMTLEGNGKFSSPPTVKQSTTHLSGRGIGSSGQGQISSGNEMYSGTSKKIMDMDPDSIPETEYHRLGREMITKINEIYNARYEN